MSDSKEITLEGQAVTEILKEVKRSKELANDFGALAWQKQRQPLPNKRFLNNTLVSTLRHSYREERKHRDGSYKKYKQHMQNRNFHKHKKLVDEEMESDQPTENIDYGEFDAAKYAETCTELYIRDSHRKHSRMRQNFVEKQNDGSSSDDSFTVEDEERDGSSESFHTNQERRKRHWSESGSTDNDQAFTIDSNSVYKRGATQTAHYIQPSGSKKRNDWNKFPKSRHIVRRPRMKHDLALFESETESDGEDEESEESDIESEIKTETSPQTQSQSRNSKRIPNDGKSLLEKLSQRSMYADIEEIKKSQNYVSNSDEEDLERNRKCGYEIKQSQRQQKDLSVKKSRIIPRKDTEEDRLRQLKYIERRAADHSGQQERVFHDKYKVSKPPRQRGYENSFYKRQRPYKYNLERRGYPTYRGRYHRQNMYPQMPLNPFYATFLMEQMKEFLMHHTDYRKRSRSRSRSHKSRNKRKYQRHRNHSRSTSSESRSYSRSRSRSKSHSRSDSSQRKSRNISESWSRSKSRSRSRTLSRSRSRSKSGKRSKHKSRSISRNRYRKRSRNKSRSRSRTKSRTRSRSKSRSRSKNRSRTRSRNKSRSRSRTKFRTRSKNKSRTRSRNKSRSRSRTKFRTRSRSKSRIRSKNKFRTRSRNKSRSRPRTKSGSRSRQRSRLKSKSRSGSRNGSKHSFRSWSSSSSKSNDHSKKDDNSFDDDISSPRSSVSSNIEYSRRPPIESTLTDSQHKCDDNYRQRPVNSEEAELKIDSEMTHKKLSRRSKEKQNSSCESTKHNARSNSGKQEKNPTELKELSGMIEEQIADNSDHGDIEEADGKVTGDGNFEQKRHVDQYQEKNECLLKFKKRKSKKAGKKSVDISNTSEADNVEETPTGENVECVEEEFNKPETDPSGSEPGTPETNNPDQDTKLLKNLL